MRVVLLVLLFVNIAFFAWGAWVDTPPSAPPSPTAKGLPPLVLAAEADAKAAAGGEAGSGETAVRSAAGTPACASIGPFNSEQQADGALAALRERGYDPRQRSEEGERWDGYWVFIGGLQSDLEEARIMRSLIQAQMSDARIMPISAEGRRISVGVFSERIRAERRARVLQRLGLEPQIGERKSPGTVYWTDVDLKPNENTVSTEGLLPADTPGPALEIRACGAASSG